MLRFLQREMGHRLNEVVDRNANLHLVTDGKSIYLEDQQDRIIDIFKNARQPMFLVCVTDQMRRLSSGQIAPRKPDANRGGFAREGRGPAWLQLSLMAAVGSA